MALKSQLLALLLLPFTLAAASLPAEQVEFFEKKIRPILAQECYECHSTSGKKKGGLLLDSRAGWQAGGDSGETIVAGEPGKSLLIRSIQHEEPDLKMPSKAPKLEDSVIRNFEEWVKMGAPDPRDRPATAAEIAQDKDWSSVFQRRTSWWSFQPVTIPAVPQAGGGWSENPIDRFLADSMEKAELAPAADAAPHVILRRLSYVLTGLAPKPEELEGFKAAAAKDMPSAIAAAADRLLASPQFGEAWARHWMDWVRFAETHGSEGDPGIPFAWRYRDYLIRALNEDVPYPQLVREHIAGDLLEKPRINEQLGINESALGAAHYRMVLHGFTPTDAYDELCTFTDNQIDTVTKAFQGLTVACARCHNHKFDAISQADYYALFGIFASTRPATVDVSLPEHRSAAVDELATRKGAIRAKVAEAWLASLAKLPEALNSWQPAAPQKIVDAKGKEVKVPPPDLGALTDWLALKDLTPDKWDGVWKKLRDRAAESATKRAQFLAQPTSAAWDLRGPDFAQWQSSGAGVRQGPTPSGEFAIATEGDRIFTGIFPAGTYSNLVSDAQRALLASPDFKCDGGKLWIRARGSGVRLRYVVRNYPRTGTIYKFVDLNGETEQWVNFDLAYWKGDTLHLEISTDEDQPVEMKGKARSWFGISEVRYISAAESPAPPAPTISLWEHLVAEGRAAQTERQPSSEREIEPRDPAELAQVFVALLRTAIEHWRDGRANDLDAELLNQFARQNLLPNTLTALPEAAALVAEYRTAEAALPLPTRAPGLLEGFARDWPLLTRGDHKKEAEPVPRRFLEAIDARPFNAGERESGRRQLAEKLVAPTNPLTSRVIVNRLWLNVFGQGLVPTPDNFGRLGEAPTHPELLDYLAGSFDAQGGSIKKFLRALVTTRAFRLDHRAAPAAAERDPQNRLLTHFRARRLEAEQIRDSIIALTGKLDEKIGGEPVGPANTRRSIYEKVIRNNLDPLLTAFDFPVPSATRGQRDATNVPAQALALLNDKLVSQWAEEWARRIEKSGALPDDEARARRMFLEAFGRPASAAELTQALAFATAEVSESSGNANQPATNWRALAQALINAKEFIYLP